MGRRHDLEEELAEIISPQGLLLAIGDKRISYGAAKLHTGDDRWQSDFDALAERADSIIIVPGASPGTLWELSKILERPALFAKAVWAMPAGLRKTRWDEITAACLKRFDIRLPPHSKNGCFLEQRALTAG
jgi:hypothetical protein